jgi:hypothetical protein
LEFLGVAGDELDGRHRGRVFLQNENDCLHGSFADNDLIHTLVRLRVPALGNLQFVTAMRVAVRGGLPRNCNRQDQCGNGKDNQRGRAAPAIAATLEEM